MAKPNNSLNLLNLFQTVAQSLAEQQQALNQADTYNHDHGDNMVETFSLITKALSQKQDAPPSEQLAYASKLLSQQQSGSAKLYAQGLLNASKEFKGQKQITAENAMALVQALMGAEKPPAAAAQSGAGDLLGALLNAAAPAQTQPQAQQDNGLDAGDLLNAGLAFLSTKSRGGSNTEALVNALLAGSAMGNSGHRAQSGAIVINSLLQAINAMSSRN